MNAYESWKGNTLLLVKLSLQFQGGGHVEGFSKMRKVSDIFISSRLIVMKQIFRFVRFMGVQNMRELEKSWTLSRLKAGKSMLIGLNITRQQSLERNEMIN